jgi:glutaredoxin
MDKLAIIFSMKSCPHCKILKEMLDKEDIPYVDRDIDEHSDEYDMFVSITKNEYTFS